ncbi:hypothetical protein BU097_02460 [Staphylococcus xylosus]|uniref:Uncharacterized protein n=1 Tax=Staphylococcus xylosus TaxID=1288 RepID=A0A418IRC5_STAXY|nr:hypothetical protein [Staphylococcus xylosus]PTI58829.1 hypothetical protein BU103_03345 [Staphylococcus xylosus]RIN12410.1 hypothetical protein BU097_02460 [Staphylococcus xylosus]
MSTLKEICKEQTELLNECRQNIKELTEENEKLKKEVEHLKGIIQDEEDWKLLKLEEEWL